MNRDMVIICLNDNRHVKNGAVSQCRLHCVQVFYRYIGQSRFSSTEEPGKLQDVISICPNISSQTLTENERKSTVWGSQFESTRLQNYTRNHVKFKYIYYIRKIALKLLFFTTSQQ